MAASFFNILTTFPTFLIVMFNYSQIIFLSGRKSW